jgi:predicted deacylase
MEPDVAQRVAELERQLAEAMAAAQAEQRGSAQSAQALGRIVELTAELGHILQTDRQSVEMPER